MMKAEQERVKTLLLSTITQLCQNGLMYKKDLKVQGLLAITVDDGDIFVVQLNEKIGSEMEPDCNATVSLPEIAAAVGSKDFPIAGKSTEMLVTPRTAAGEHVGRVGAQLDVGNMMNCKAKVSPQFALKSVREASYAQNGGGADHDKLEESTMDFGSAGVLKDATENTSMLLPTFTIPMTVNYPASMKAFQGTECFRDSNSDQIDYVFQEFQAAASAMPNNSGRLTCPSVTANSTSGHVQTGFPSNIGQSYQQFASMISAAPQNSTKLELPGIGKRVLPQTLGQPSSFAGQAQVMTKKQKQESRLPRRPRESTEKRFRCQLCSLTYYYKKHLKFHMQQKHGLQQNMT